MTPSTIRDARVAAGLSQAQIAATLNISQQTYSRWERDPLSLPLERAVEIQRAVGLPPGSTVLDCLDLAQALVYRIKHGLQEEAKIKEVSVLLEEYLTLAAHRDQQPPLRW